MDNNAELLFVLEQLGVHQLVSIYENPEEVRQLCNKIGRPELFKDCIDEINNKIMDEDYETETSESESECSDGDLVEEQFQVNPCANGFCELELLCEKDTCKKGCECV